MKKIFVISIAILFSTLAYSQSKYLTRSGQITFESSVPAFEEVKATNNKVSAVLKDDGSFASLVLIKGFRFKVALMEEHFNENYMESGKFPKASFSGKIKSLELEKLTDTFQEYNLDGKLNIRGITKNISTKCKIKKDGSAIIVVTEFETKPELFGIEIPKVVRNKIAKSVIVSVDYKLSKK